MEERPPLHQGLPEPSVSTVEEESPRTFVGHMIAGAAAGITEHTAMYPVDTVKTRMQALAHPGQRPVAAPSSPAAMASAAGPPHMPPRAAASTMPPHCPQLHRSSMTLALRNVLRREGVGGLYRGVAAVAWGAGPAHALHFAVYESAKRMYGAGSEGYHIGATAAAGATATVVNDAIMTPVDVVKQRLQVAHSPYQGVADCLRSILRQEGVGALFRSYRTTLIMNIPFTAVHFSVYEAAKRWLMRVDDEDEGLVVQLVAGGLAGGTASALTTPLDVVKTRLQLEGVHSPRRYHSSALKPVLQRIVAEEGWAALWRGWQPRVAFHVPAAAVCWGTYETVKSLLHVP